MGGIGFGITRDMRLFTDHLERRKTQLALGFGHECHSKGRNVYWLSAINLETLRRSFIEAGQTASGGSQTSGEQSVDAVRSFFETKYQKWLLIFDNCDDPNVNISFPSNKDSDGRVLITSRDLTLSTNPRIGGAVLSIPLMSPLALLQMFDLEYEATDSGLELSSLLFQEAVGDMINLSLLTKEETRFPRLPDFDRLKVHPVIHDWLRARLSAEAQDRTRYLGAASRIPLSILTGELVLEEYLRVDKSDIYTHIVHHSSDFRRYRSQLRAGALPVETPML